MQVQTNPEFLRKKGLILAREIVELKQKHDCKEFEGILNRAIREIAFVSRLSKKQKRRVVIKAIKNHVCELDELIEETKISRPEVKRILQVLLRARLIIVKRRPHYLNEKKSKGTPVYFWHESETILTRESYL